METTKTVKKELTEIEKLKNKLEVRETIIALQRKIIDNLQKELRRKFWWKFWKY